jgi:3-oxoacyl-[acyl-carrier-protein] synthase II
VGAVTGYGWGLDALYAGFDAGETCVTRIEGYEGYTDEGYAYLSPIPKDGGLESDGPSVFMRAMRAAAREAVEDARARGWVPGERVGVVHAIVLGDVESWSKFYKTGVNGKKVNPREWVSMMPSTVVSMMMKEFDFHGPSMNVSAMCSSSNVGLITAKSWLDAGLCTDVLFVTTDLSGTVKDNIRGFADTGVMVTHLEPLDASRPLQEGTVGFVGGEAAVGIMLSNKSEGLHGALLGGAMNMDASSAVGLDPENVELFRCFRDAMDSAGIGADEVVYLNAHAPGTVQCNVAEGRIIDELLTEVEGAFSVKPFVGHCQGAAAAVEVLATIYAFDTGFIPATPHVAKAHPKLLNGRTPRKPGIMAKSSIGMGGYNAVTVFAGPEDLVDGGE